VRPMKGTYVHTGYYNRTKVRQEKICTTELLIDVLRIRRNDAYRILKVKKVSKDTDLPVHSPVRRRIWRIYRSYQLAEALPSYGQRFRDPCTWCGGSHRTKDSSLDSHCG
jgi:hypothetical protein